MRVTNSVMPSCSRRRSWIPRYPSIFRAAMPLKISLRNNRSYASAFWGVVQPRQSLPITPEARGSRTANQVKVVLQPDRVLDAQQHREFGDFQAKITEAEGGGGGPDDILARGLHRHV